MNNTTPTSFPTKASQKKALDHLSRQYRKIRRLVMNKLLEQCHQSRCEDWNEMYWSCPNDLHQVRDRHSTIWEHVGMDFSEVMALKELREETKKVPVIKPPKKEKSEGVRTERSATHRGTCQICGRHHKVGIKNGLMAEHGYTVEYGYFQGSCMGSGQLPLNVSCDFLKEQYDKLNASYQFMSKDPDAIHHVLKSERYDRQLGKYVEHDVIVTNRMEMGNIKPILEMWEKVLTDWKPFDLVEIKYDS